MMSNKRVSETLGIPVFDKQHADMLTNVDFVHGWYLVNFTNRFNYPIKIVFIQLNGEENIYTDCVKPGETVRTGTNNYNTNRLLIRKY